jgi:hypothetical protein
MQCDSSGSDWLGKTSFFRLHLGRLERTREPGVLLSHISESKGGALKSGLELLLRSLPLDIRQEAAA